MARRTISNEVRMQIVSAVTGGSKVADVARNFGVSVPTVYNYVRIATATTTVEVPETVEA